MAEFYSTFEVAKMCHVSPGSVTRWIREGRLPASLTVGGHHRIKKSDLLELLKNLRMPIPEEFHEREKRVSILIVDDEPGIRQMIRWMLEQNFPGALVEEAQEGFAAGWKAHGICPQLVLLDLMIPGMDGFGVCQFIRSFPDLKNTKIIAMTALHDPQIREKMLRMGANDFLVKPFEMDVLKEKIIEQLNSGGAGPVSAAS